MRLTYIHARGTPTTTIMCVCARVTLQFILHLVFMCVCILRHSVYPPPPTGAARTKRVTRFASTPHLTHTHAHTHSVGRSPPFECVRIMHMLVLLLNDLLGDSSGRTIFLRNNKRRHLGAKVTQQCDARFAVRLPLAVVDDAVGGGCGGGGIDVVLVAVWHGGTVMQLNGSGGARVIS